MGRARPRGHRRPRRPLRDRPAQHRRRHRLGRRPVDRHGRQAPEHRRRTPATQPDGADGRAGHRGPAVPLRARRVRRLRQRPPCLRAPGRRHHVRVPAPGWTNYDTTVNYFTYDVTDLLADPAQVTLAAVLGNGWYNGRVSENSTHYSADGNPWPSRRNSSSGTPTAPPGRSSPPPAPTGEPPTPAPTAPTTSTTASSTTPARNSRVGRRTASTPRPGRPSRLKTLSPTPSWSRIPARAPA